MTGCNRTTLGPCLLILVVGGCHLLARSGDLQSHPIPGGGGHVMHTGGDRDMTMVALEIPGHPWEFPFVVMVALGISKPTMGTPEATHGDTRTPLCG